MERLVVVLCIAQWSGTPGGGGGWGLFRRGQTKRIGPLWKLRSFYYFKYESVKFTSYAYLKTLQEQPFLMVFERYGIMFTIFLYCQ
jgi:hypothetical protein